MDDRKDDLIPEWETKPNNTNTTPATTQQPINEYRAFSEPSPEFQNGLQPQVKKTSGLGITSFVLGFLGALIIVVLCVVAATLVSDFITAGETFDMEAFQNNDNYAIIALVGFGMIAAMIAMFIGFILGIVALLQKNRKKGFAIAGTIINGLFVCGTAFLFIIGLLSGLAA